MSILRNLLGTFMPHFEARQASGLLNALNAEVVLDVSGDNSATIYLNPQGSTPNMTYAVEGSVDGTNYFALLAFPYPPGCVGGTIPQAAQPLITEAVNAASLVRTLSVAVGQLAKVRVRASAYTGGSFLCTIRSDVEPALNPYVRDQKSATLMVTATGASGAAVTATIPAVAGLRHYIDRVQVVRSATAVLTAAATPVVVTTTNLPGTPALTFGSDAAAQGVDKEQILDFSGAGLAATAINTATTIVCPVYTGVIWRVNVAYRLGM